MKRICRHCGKPLEKRNTRALGFVYVHPISSTEYRWFCGRTAAEVATVKDYLKKLV